MLRGKTVIMASNSVKRFQDADHIVYLEDSTVKAEGSYQDLVQIPSVSAKIAQKKQKISHEFVSASLSAGQIASMFRDEHAREVDYEDEVDNEARATRSGVVKAVHFYLANAGWSKVILLGLACLLGTCTSCQGTQNSYLL